MKKSDKKYNSKKLYIIFLLLIIIYIGIHLVEFGYIYYLFLLVYEFIINTCLVWLKYSGIFIRATLPYVVVYIGFCLFNIYFYKNRFYVNKGYEKPTYILFIIKEYNNYILLLSHFLFLSLVFYFELYYNVIVLLVIISMFFFIGLSVYIKYLFKGKDTLGKKSNLLINCVLGIVLGVLVVLLSELINDNIYFKNNISDYFYKMIQKKNRVFLKYKRDNYGYGTKHYVAFKQEKIYQSYLYLKNKLLNRNVLNDIAYNKIKYELLKNQKMLGKNYNEVLENNALNDFEIKKSDLQFQYKNNESAQLNKNYVGNEVIYDNKRLFNAFKELNFKRNYKKIKLHMYNVYKLHGTNYLPEDAKKFKLKNSKMIFKKLIKNGNKQGGLVGDNLLNIKLKNLYNMDYENIIKKKKKLYSLLYKENKNKIKKYYKPYVYNVKYKRFFNFIERLQNLKKEIFKLELNPFTFLIYKYNDFIIGGDKKCHIILCKYKSNFVKAKLLTLYKKHKNYYNYLRIKKKTHVGKFKRSKVYVYDKKRYFFEWYKQKPYKKYPKYIFNNKERYNANQLIININKSSNLILACKSADKGYEQKYLKVILNGLGLLKKKPNLIIRPKEFNMMHFLEENSGNIYTIQSNESKWNLDIFLEYFKRAIIYDYLLLKHNDSDGFKYIKWMTAKYTKVTEGSARMYKDFYRSQGNNKQLYNSFIEQYNYNKNTNEIAHNKSVKEANLLKFLIQYNRSNGIDDYNLDVVNWLYFSKDGNLIEYLADIEEYGNNMKLKDYKYKPNLYTKPYFNEFICLEEYKRIEEDFENFNHGYYENFMHQIKVVEIIIENSIIGNAFFENEDVLAVAYNQQKNILIEKFLSAGYDVFDQLNERVELGEFYELEEANEELMFGLEYFNEGEYKMEHDIEQHVKHRELMLSRPGITLDNIFDRLLTDEVRIQDPASYYYLVESLKFDDEYQYDIRMDIVLERFLSKSYLLAEKKKDNIKILGKYNFEILLSLLEFENGLNETVESIDSEMQQKMLHFNEIYENIIENNKIIEIDKVDEKDDLAKRYTEIESYLINKDWDSYMYKRYKEEMFSLKGFKRDL